MTPTIELIDKTIKTISGRELVASSEMIDVLLDLRMLCELQTPTEKLTSVGTSN